MWQMARLPSVSMLRGSSAMRYDYQSNVRAHTLQQNTFDQRQTQQRIARRKDVVEHYTEATVPCLIKMANGRRLDDVEKPEQRKREQTPEQTFWGKEQHQQHGHNLVPHDAAIVRHTQRTPGLAAHPHAEGEQPHQQHDEHGIGKARCEIPVERKSDQRTYRSWRTGEQAAAETE